MQWIPVTERLPIENVEVICTREYSVGSNKYTGVDVGTRIGDEWCFDCDERSIGRVKKSEVIAWMEFPTPYSWCHENDIGGTND